MDGSFFVKEDNVMGAIYQAISRFRISALYSLKKFNRFDTLFEDYPRFAGIS